MAAPFSRPRLRARNSTHSNDPLGNETSGLAWLHIDASLYMEAVFTHQLTLSASRHVYTVLLSNIQITAHREKETEREREKEKPKSLKNAVITVSILCMVYKA